MTIAINTDELALRIASQREMYSYPFRRYVDRNGYTVSNRPAPRVQKFIVTEYTVVRADDQLG